MSASKGEIAVIHADYRNFAFASLPQSGI